MKDEFRTDEFLRPFVGFTWPNSDASVSGEFGRAQKITHTIAPDVRKVNSE
jgi:hypothetical protein